MTARGTTAATPIVIYRVTGRQGLVSVPDWVCRECDLTVAAVTEACRQADGPPEAVVVKPWLTHVGEAWHLGARHPPAVLVRGQLYSQAVVPDVGPLAAYLRRAVSEGGP